MFKIEYCERATRWGAMLALLLVVAAPKLASADAAGIDPQAEKLLKASTRFLASQKQFSVSTQGSIEVVLTSGQKLQFDHAASLLVQRPNKLRAERQGDLVDQVFFYDGQSLTLYNPGNRIFATVAAPATLEGMLDFARDSLDIVAPAGDLVYSNAFDILMQDVTTGFVVGKSMVDGVRCDHLAFRTPHADWQIWLQEGAQPLPRKLVITSRDVVNAPQFAVVMRKWNLAPKLNARMFEFTPPMNPRQIDFLPLGNTSAQPQ